MPSLGELIASTRHAKKLTLRQVSEKTGLSDPVLCNIEKGHTRSPTFYAVAQIAKALGVSLDKFLAADLQPTHSEKTLKLRSRVIKRTWSEQRESLAEKLSRGAKKRFKNLSAAEQQAIRDRLDEARELRWEK